MELRPVLISIVLLLGCANTGLAETAAPFSGNLKTASRPFLPGEKLTYSVSWSKVLEAGIAVMEVQKGSVVDGRPTYRFISRTHSVGIVDSVYPVKDMVESIVDIDDLESITFTLRESHGKRKRERDMLFDRERHTVKVTVNNSSETFTVPERIQDALSSLYYVRTRHDFIVDKPIVVNVHDSGKTWAVEVHTLGKETIKTPAGEFSTIKLKTYPKYEGVFMNKGEIYIWITDDGSRIPVLMKSIISIGSIVATLTEMQGVRGKP